MLPNKDRVEHDKVGLLVDSDVAGEEALLGLGFTRLTGLEFDPRVIAAPSAAGGQQIGGLAACLGGGLEPAARSSQLGSVLCC